MGCASSKIDDLEAVKLCRERCDYLELAIRRRYAFADSHVAYIHSLKVIGITFQRIFDEGLDKSGFPPSPVLPLPTQRKGEHITFAAESTSFPPPAAVVTRDSNSNSGHIQFHSDSEDIEHGDDDDDDDSGSLHHHSGHSSPLHQPHEFQPSYQFNQVPMDSFPGGFMNMNYMRNRPTPSVSYEQRPMSPDVVRVDASSSYYSHSYPGQDSASYPSYPYQPYPSYGSFFGSQPMSYGGSSSTPPHMAARPSSSTSSKPPPPPPSPPSNSPWDFLNPFETLESYKPLYTPSRNSIDVREEEGIPDLEEEDLKHEVVKEVHSVEKFADDDESGNYYKKVEDDEVEHGNDDEQASLYQTKPSVSVEGVEFDVAPVEKNVISKEEGADDQVNMAAFKARVLLGGASEVVLEIKIQFERAADAGSEVSRMLEAGRLPYRKKKGVYQVSSKMLHAVTPSLSSQLSTSKRSEASSSTEKSSSAYADLEGRSASLSATLQKLYMWEKKLYDEVKAEEKMRVEHDRKRKRLLRLDEKGAEAHKVVAVQTLVRNLSTKIRMAIQFVDRTSIKIATLRDEELWPQLNELIHGLFEMWKLMLECHRNQCQAITEVKNLDAIISSRLFGADHLETAMQLQHEVLDWISNFCNWIGTQKGYITALNTWLLKCIYEEPEETPDGRPPFSPGRIGAPPVFVICNQWSQAMERISEKEVVDAMVAFAVGLRHKLGIFQPVTAGDVEKKSKGLERDELNLQKAIQALDKKIVMVSGHGSGALVPEQLLHQRDLNNIGSLQSGLKQIFDALERFTASCVQTYEELHVRIEEDRLARENAKVP